ncbi:MAG TPA: biopolymer transporter ExbD [Steroidobacteraceae bacterium]|jgi:biopolymer transport protein ExbD|nr:biopolymer transporter ExbD [Steroidobacteraceae bacterium]
MSMSVGGGDGEDDKVLSDINTTPLVDVMLVMLIIFLITIPIITKVVPVALPTARNIPTQTKPENITVSITANGTVYWQGAEVDRSQLLNLVIASARQVPQPEIHMRADRQARFEAVGRVIWVIQQGGVVKVGFLTEPRVGT